MKPITEKHKSLLYEWANDWWFKEWIMSYTEKETYKKLLHGRYNGINKPRTKVDFYTEAEAEIMNELRLKWIEYKKMRGTENDPRPKAMR